MLTVPHCGLSLHFAQDWNFVLVEKRKTIVSKLDIMQRQRLLLPVTTELQEAAAEACILISTPKSKKGKKWKSM